MYRVMKIILLIVAGIVSSVTASPSERVIPECIDWEYRSSDGDRLIYSKPGILQWRAITRPDGYDSLTIPWPEDYSENARNRTLVFSVSEHSETHTPTIQFGVKTDDEVFLLPLTYASLDFSLPHSGNPNCFTVTDTFSGSWDGLTVTPDSLIIRIGNIPGDEGDALISIRDLHVDSGNTLIRFLPSPVPAKRPETDPYERISFLCPIPFPGQWHMRFAGTVPGMDHSVAIGSFVVRNGHQLVYPEIGMQLEYLENQFRFQALCEDSIHVFYCNPGINGFSKSSPFTLSVIIPVSPEITESIVIDSLECEFRDAHAQATDLILSKIIRLSDSALRVELKNMRYWPVNISGITVRFGDREIPASVSGIRFVEGHGFVRLDDADATDPSQPPLHYRIRLCADSECLDSLAYGVIDSLPFPPVDYSLSRIGNRWAINPSPFPGDPDVIPRIRETDSGRILLSELYMWDDNRSASFVELTNAGETDINVSDWKLLAHDILPLGFKNMIPSGTSYVITDLPETFSFQTGYGSVYLLDQNGYIIDRYSWTQPPSDSQSLHRVFRAERDTLIWEEGFPSPGQVQTTFITPQEVHITPTHNGIVIQWTCAQSDSLSFDIYRTEPGTSDPPVRVSTFPVVGMDMFSFVDLTAETGTDYTYWLVRDNGDSAEQWFGPYMIPGERETMPISIAVPKPNPFSEVLYIDYDIGTLDEELLSSIQTTYKPGRRMMLTVYSIDGRLVRILGRDVLLPGSYSDQWDGTNDLGMKCPPGVYLISLQLGPFSQSVRVVFMKKQ